MGFHTGWGTALDQLVTHVKKLRVECEAKSGCNSARRHPVEFRQGWIDVVPGVTAYTVRHRLRPVSAGVVKASRVYGEQVRHGRERHIHR